MCFTHHKVNKQATGWLSRNHLYKVSFLGLWFTFPDPKFYFREEKGTKKCFSYRLMSVTCWVAMCYFKRLGPSDHLCLTVLLALKQPISYCLFLQMPHRGPVKTKIWPLRHPSGNGALILLSALRGSSSLWMCFYFLSSELNMSFIILVTCFHFDWDLLTLRWGCECKQLIKELSWRHY